MTKLLQKLDEIEKEDNEKSALFHATRQCVSQHQTYPELRTAFLEAVEYLKATKGLFPNYYTTAKEIDEFLEKIGANEGKE